MPLINTQYDGKIGKIFVLRGDVGYASSTDTLLDIISDGNSKNSIDGYKVGFKYNVLRDKGASKVVLYDDDEVLAEYDWDSDDGETFVGVLNNHTTVDPTTCLYLSYGKEHNLTMRYKGNDKCMKSKSRKVRVYEPIPPQFESSVTISNVEVGWNWGTVINGTVEVLMGGVETEYCNNVDVEIYLDGKLKTTVTTGSNPPTANFQLTDVSMGSHVITAYIVPTDSINSATTDYIKSVGYKLQITSYPTPFVLGVDNKIVVSVTDFNNEPLVGGTVSFNRNSATTDAKGEATFTLNYIEDGSYVASYSNYSSEPITIRTYEPDFNMAFSKNPITTNETTTLVATLSQPVPNVPFRISEKYYQHSEELEHYDLLTDSNGSVSMNISSRSTDKWEWGGLYDYVGLVGNATKKTTLKDAFVWYDASDGESNSVGLNNVSWDKCKKTTSAQGLVIQRTESGTPRIITPMQTFNSFKFIFEMDFIPNDFDKIVIMDEGIMESTLIPVTNGRLQTLKIIKEASVMDVYLDNEIIFSQTPHQDSQFRFALNGTTGKENMAIIKTMKFYDSTNR